MSSIVVVVVVVAGAARGRRPRRAGAATFGRPSSWTSSPPPPRLFLARRAAASCSSGPRKSNPDLPTDSLGPTFVVANVFTYLRSSLWTWATPWTPLRPRSLRVVVLVVLLSIVSFAAAGGGFAVYGGRLFAMSASSNVESKGRRPRDWAPSQPSARRVFSRVRGWRRSALASARIDSTCSRPRAPTRRERCAATRPIGAVALHPSCLAELRDKRSRGRGRGRGRPRTARAADIDASRTNR